MNEINVVKEFWENRPCNIRHSQKEIGTYEYFEEVERKKFFVEKHIPSFTEFEKWKGKKVLEIGCGIGTAAINFAKNGAIYTGIELSNNSLDITKKRFDIYGFDGKFYNGNAEELSQILPNEKYDLVYSFGVIHHSPKPQKIIQEIKNFCHEDTIVKIMLYAKDSWKNYMIESGLDQPEAQFGCPIAYTYTKQEVEDLLEGFKILSIEQDHIFPYEIESYKKNEYKKVSWFENMPENIFNVLEKNLGWHLLINAKVDKS